VKRDALVEAAHRERLPEIAIPREVCRVTALPLLGSGKTDYPAVQLLAAAANDSVGAEAAGPEDTPLVAG
jgi:acyl-[acyl-carrier-protein]-phospholipid O-acyltransferase / long-chain-fatty-acid--[acyl-carrier-protein] ligase